MCTWPYNDVNILQVFFTVQFIHDRTTFWQIISAINTIVIAIKKLSYIAYMSQQYHYHTIAFLVIAIVHVLKLAIFHWYMTKIVIIQLLIIISQNTIGPLLGNSSNFQGCLEKFVSKFPESFRFQWPQWTLKSCILHISGYQYQAGCNYVLILVGSSWQSDLFLRKWHDNSCYQLAYSFLKWSLGKTHWFN